MGENMTETGSEIPDTDPLALFDAWYAEAEKGEPHDPNAMALATATAQGAPSVRMVLLKRHGDDTGFTFYTNAHSRKGEEIRQNMQAALLFHWKSIERQVRIEGPLREVGAAQADSYFHSRARESQLGSAASNQSRPMASRAQYEERIAALAEQYPEGNIPRPPHWTGFTVEVQRMEFWLDRPNRLHDRRLFSRDVKGWHSSLLFP